MADYEYTWRDGEMLEVHVAAAFDLLAAEFFRVFGLTLHCNSGVRTEEKQWELYNGWINRLPGYNLAAKPQDSYHCVVGPQGPRACDFRDSGSDAGVMTIGTVRNNWLRDNMPRFGWTLSGLTFSYPEGWHGHFTGVIGGAAGGAGGAWPARERYGHDWVVAAQNKLNRLGFDVGDEDGYDGPRTQGGTRELQEILGVDKDGIFGPITNAGADTILSGGNFTNRPTADVQRVVGANPDNEWGPITSKRTYIWQKAEGLTADAQWGPQSDGHAAAKGLFGAAPTPPEGEVGSNETNRPTREIQAKVGMTGDQIDDLYGPETTRYVKAWQLSMGLLDDGIWGSTSDGVAFPPAGSISGVDYSFARPDPKLLQSRGIKLAGRYLWNAKYQDGRINKGIDTAELMELRAADVEVFFIYEEDGKELQGGFDAGVRVARAAEAFLQQLGEAGQPIYFNVDYDAQADELPKLLAALDGIASVIGLERVGLYAGFGPIKAAFDAGKIAWGFQTYAWSGGRWDVRAQLQQWSNGQWGGSVDFTRAMVPEFGQTAVAPKPPTTPEVKPIARAKVQAVADELNKLLAE